jgi:hypothetical protein
MNGHLLGIVVGILLLQLLAVLLVLRLPVPDEGGLVGGVGEVHPELAPAFERLGECGVRVADFALDPVVAD